VQLVRDVLDKQILDKEDVKIGKVDGLIIALRKGRPPRVIALELGTATAVYRIGARLGRWVERLERRLGIATGDRVRIRFEHVVRTGIDVEIDIDGRKAGALKWEDWLRDHVIGPIPGSRR
jgi:hypothetical protein